MEKRRATLVLCVVSLLTAILVGSVLSGASARSHNRADKDLGDVLQAAGYLLGPKPGVELRILPPGEKIHINAKIHCGQTGQQGDHLHIHSGNVQFKADVIMVECDGEGESGFAEGSAMGLCNGQMTTADVILDDNPSTVDVRKEDEDFAQITLVGPGCNTTTDYQPFQGNIEFKDNTPSPAPSTSSVSAPPDS